MNNPEKLKRREIIAGMLKYRLFMNSDFFVRIFRIQGLVVFGCLTILLIGCEVRDIDPETGKVIIEEQQPDFDAVEYVNDIWQDKIIKTVREEAVELATLLETSDKENAAEAERQEQSGSSRPSVFLVKGSGKVIEADTTSRVGFLLVDVSSSAEEQNVRLQIGPVISGTALRDALPFISFDQFSNQIEYAAVSRALHDHLVETELGRLDYAGLKGSEIRFSGAAVFEKKQAVIIPVEIEVKEQ